MLSAQDCNIGSRSLDKSVAILPHHIHRRLLAIQNIMLIILDLSEAPLMKYVVAVFATWRPTQYYSVNKDIKYI